MCEEAVPEKFARSDRAGIFFYSHTHPGERDRFLFDTVVCSGHHKLSSASNLHLNYINKNYPPCG